MESIVQQRGNVSFPEHAGERVYMREFFKDGGLPADLRRWQRTVDAMLDGVETDGPIYLMIDQGIVKAGTPHRRPGVHIDGYWVPAVQAHHGRGGGGHRGSPQIERGGHGSRPSGHRSAPLTISPGAHRGSSGGHLASWEESDFSVHEGLILASTISACRAFSGHWDDVPHDGGDCSHIDTSRMDEIILDSGRVYAGNVTMLHESIPVPFDCLRTLVRLNVPGWTPQ